MRFSLLFAFGAEGKVHCSFMFAKSRLAPWKTVSIPRLEGTSGQNAQERDRNANKRPIGSLD